MSMRSFGLFAVSLFTIWPSISKELWKDGTKMEQTFILVERKGITWKMKIIAGEMEKRRMWMRQEMAHCSTLRLNNLV